MKDKEFLLMELVTITNGTLEGKIGNIIGSSASNHEYVNAYANGYKVANFLKSFDLHFHIRLLDGTEVRIKSEYVDYIHKTKELKDYDTETLIKELISRKNVYTNESKNITINIPEDRFLIYKY